MSDNTKQLTPEEYEAWEIQCYGCRQSDIDKTINESIDGPHMIAMSMLSDAQEMLLRDRGEDARQLMNIAKYIIGKLDERRRHARELLS